MTEPITERIGYTFSAYPIRAHCVMALGEGPAAGFREGLVAGDHVLITDGGSRGVYVVQNDGSWSRDGYFYARSYPALVFVGSLLAPSYTFYLHTPPEPPTKVWAGTFSQVQPLAEEISQVQGYVAGAQAAQAGAETARDEAEAAAVVASSFVFPAGAVIEYSGITAPAGWLMAFGQAELRSVYPVLDQVMADAGYPFGDGDGVTTFNVVDRRGRAGFGKDNMGGVAANRITLAISGVDGATLGATGGDEAMMLHSHVVDDPGHTHPLDNAVNAGINGGGSVTQKQNAIADGGQLSVAPANTGITLEDAGTGSSENMPPAIIMNYIVKT